MGEEFQGGVCGGNWWNSSRKLFGSSPCSSSINDMCSFNEWSSGQHATSPSTNYAPLDQDLAPSSTVNHSWSQDLMYNNTGKSEPNYCQEAAALNPSMTFCDTFSTDSLNQDFSSYGYTTSSLLQTPFETQSQPHQLLNNQLMNYSSAETRPMIDDFLPISPTFSPNHLKFTNNTPFWNANATPNFPTLTQPQIVLPSIDNPKINTSNFTRKHNTAEKMGSVAKKTINEPAVKRSRVETPSPLPTFKVRKEKLGDHVTALQQLVSPFGKTDTASVLHEAIEYIKFLHDQVGVLSTPYLRKGSSPMQCQQATDDNKDQQDLRSRGLCLVPITSTFPVATESPTDYWTPTFGGSIFR